MQGVVPGISSVMLPWVPYFWPLKWRTAKTRQVKDFLFSFFSLPSQRSLSTPAVQPSHEYSRNFLLEEESLSIPKCQSDNSHGNNLGICLLRGTAFFKRKLVFTRYSVFKREFRLVTRCSAIQAWNSSTTCRYSWLGHLWCLWIACARPQCIIRSNRFDVNSAVETREQRKKVLVWRVHDMAAIMLFSYSLRSLYVTFRPSKPVAL